MSDLFTGLMSGTSMDAIDAVLVDFSSVKPRLIAHHAHPIPDTTRSDLLSLVSPANNELQRSCQLDISMGQLFAEAVLALLETAQVAARDVTAIGSHGQTLRHYPLLPNSLQIGDPNTIAELTGITTVADFRRRDMAAGGQGAPLVPAFHKAVFHSANVNRVILNIGGIANITILPTDNNAVVSGFDTGPGNGLMDEWVGQHLKLAYDRDGEWGASGHVHPGLLERMLNDAYFTAAPPKSSGREYFNLQWLAPMLDAFPHLAERDVQTSLCELTARSITDAIQHYAADTQEVLVCGGGVHNRLLMQRLDELLSPCKVRTTSDAGLDPDWVEAMAFAWLAKQTLAGKPGHLPAVTGAKHPVVLGGIYPGSIYFD